MSQHDLGWWEILGGRLVVLQEDGSTSSFSAVWMVRPTPPTSDPHTSSERLDVSDRSSRSTNNMLRDPGGPLNCSRCRRSSSSALSRRLATRRSFRNLDRSQSLHLRRGMLVPSNMAVLSSRTGAPALPATCRVAPQLRSNRDLVSARCFVRQIEVPVLTVHLDKAVSGQDKVPDGQAQEIDDHPSDIDDPARRDEDEDGRQSEHSD